MRAKKGMEESCVLIVTGSTLRAEQADRPLAYKLKETIEHRLDEDPCQILVLSDLWYLNDESLQKRPTISIGGPGVNALAAQLYDSLPSAMLVDQTLLIQMDPHLADLRVSIWGTHRNLTANAIELFTCRGYLGRFMEAAISQFS